MPSLTHHLMLRGLNLDWGTLFLAYCHRALLCVSSIVVLTPFRALCVCSCVCCVVCQPTVGRAVEWLSSKTTDKGRRKALVRPHNTPRL